MSADIEELNNSVAGGLRSLRIMLTEAVEKVDNLAARSTAISRRVSPPKSTWICFVILGASVLAISANYPEAKSVTVPTSEIELTRRAEHQSKQGNFVAVRETAGEMNRAGHKASGAYWEGLACHNLNEPERAAQAFVLAARYRHPLAEAALSKVRR